MSNVECLLYILVTGRSSPKAGVRPFLMALSFSRDVLTAKNDRRSGGHFIFSYEWPTFP
jgi:hypothetical protein